MIALCPPIVHTKKYNTREYLLIRFAIPKKYLSINEDGMRKIIINLEKETRGVGDGVWGVGWGWGYFNFKKS
jgi:hypothetical protein